MRLSRPEADYVAIAGDGPPPIVLNWKGLAVMSLVADRIIAPTDDMPSVSDTMTARRIDLELSYGSAKLQSDMKASLGYLEVLPALSGDLRPFSSLSAAEQADTLRGMSASAGTDRAIYVAGVVRQTQSRLCFQAGRALQAARSWRHSRRAASRFCLKRDRELRWRSRLK